MSTNTINRIVVQAIDTLFEDSPGLFSGSDKTFFINSLQDAVTGIIGEEITLLKTEPDYEKVFLQLSQRLSQDPEWYDLIASATGGMLLRAVCAGIAYSQFAIERAVQETFLHAASSDNSIYAATRMLGVRPRRRLPAIVEVDLTRDDSVGIVIIPKLSQFTVGNIKFYNRKQITFQRGQLATTANLYQGQVVTEELTSTGQTFQSFELGLGNDSIADSDFRVLVDNEEWSVNQLGLWSIGKNATEYYETTSASKNLSIHFGNFSFGRIPARGAIIRVSYVETLGFEGNIPAADLEVSLDDDIEDVDVIGRTTSNAYGGDASKTTDYYKQLAPHHFSSKNRAVRRSDYRALATEQSGVEDALFRGQAELAPRRRSMMNVIGVTLLTTTEWSEGQFNSWARTFKEDYAIYQCDFLNIPAENNVVDITATVYCRYDADLKEVKDRLESTIGAFFEPKLGHLGFSIYRTDITDILNGRDVNNPDEKLEQTIEYVVLDNPLTDFIFEDSTKYASLGKLNLTVEYTSRGGFSGRQDLNPVIS